MTESQQHCRRALKLRDMVKFMQRKGKLVKTRDKKYSSEVRVRGDMKATYAEASTANDKARVVMMVVKESRMTFEVQSVL